MQLLGVTGLVVVHKALSNVNIAHRYLHTKALSSAIGNEELTRPACTENNGRCSSQWGVRKSLTGVCIAWLLSRTFHGCSLEKPSHIAKWQSLILIPTTVL